MKTFLLILAYLCVFQSCFSQQVSRFEEMLKLANKGNVAAQYNIGVMYADI